MRGASLTAGAVAAAVLTMLGIAAPAAAAPVGDLVAVARQQAVVDAAGSRIAFDVDGRVVRVVDVADGTSRDVDVSAGCAAPPAPRRMVAGVGGGAVLLVCDDPEGSRWPVARVLDEVDGFVKRPLGVQPGAVLPDMITSDGRLRMQRSAPRTPNYFTAIDWRTGREELWDPRVPCRGWATGYRRLARCDGARTIALPAARWITYAFARGLLAWTEARAVGVGVPECGATLRWRVGLLGAVVPLPGAALVSSPALDGSWTITRVPLDGLCERTTARWAVHASARGRVVTAAIAAAAVPDAETGASAGVLAEGLRRLPSLRVRVGGRVLMRAQAPARSLRWRLGSGRWVTVRERSGRWVLQLPASLRRPATLRTELTLAAGGTVSHVLRLAPLWR